jgi:uncharacterized protein (DUF3084 family)
MTKTENQIAVKDVAHALIKANHELQMIHAATPVELEKMAAKICKLNVLADIRLKQLDHEKELIQSTREKAWDLFSKAISPAMKIHDDLAEIYTELTSILQSLETLKRSRVSTETLTTELAALQDRLHKVEAKKDPVLNQFCIKKENDFV